MKELDSMKELILLAEEVTLTQQEVARQQNKVAHMQRKIFSYLPTTYGHDESIDIKQIIDPEVIAKQIQEHLNSTTFTLDASAMMQKFSQSMDEAVEAVILHGTPLKTQKEYLTRIEKLANRNEFAIEEQLSQKELLANTLNKTVIAAAFVVGVFAGIATTLL